MIYSVSDDCMIFTLNDVHLMYYFISEYLLPIKNNVIRLQSYRKMAD